MSNLNYQGIVNWLQRDNFVMLGFAQHGEAVMMERDTGREVSDLPSFLIASILPVAKRKVAQQLMEKCDYVEFKETVDKDGCHARITERYYEANRGSGFFNGSGETMEYAMISAIEAYIKNEVEFFTQEKQEKVNDKG